jgi:uncharacterized membrane protein
MGTRTLYARMLIAVLALVGFFDATYLMVSRYLPNMSMVCPVTGDGCEQVRDSVWSVFPPSFLTSVHIPVALIGMFGYALVFVIGMMALRRDHAGGLALPPVLVGLSTFGVVFSAYLVSLQLFVIQAVCSWCVLSAILMTSIWLCSIYDWRQWRSQSAGGSAEALASSA